MTSQPSMAAQLATVIEQVPGVAFLKPDLTTRLRSALNTARPTRPRGGLDVRRADDGTWTVRADIVIHAHARAVDTTRDTHDAIARELAQLMPDQPCDITVTVTGAV
ncbi:hypothetical protein GTY65_00640 [Streptomyces sp. SID8379]|uniref:hypothetical protein n=1 Tax=unclassified Streptomyces TaxID=2593676 RepID=UPI0003A6BBE7|nr:MULTISPECIES: hypothetical protein [unclassified Streptomyces]MYW62592.1 hypothetical protein [Streptomyces sp. SID8379]